MPSLPRRQEPRAGSGERALTGTRAGSRRSATLLVGRELRRWDRRAVAPGAGLRAGTGVLVVLAAGHLAGAPAAGAAAAIGAFSVGIASLQGAYRTRVRATVLTSLAMALSTGLGGVIGGRPWLGVPVIALWALAAGLVTVLGDLATIIGLQAVVALLVVGTFPMSVPDAVLRGGLVLAGGLVQSLLVVAVWPLRLSTVERSALAAAYRSLAAYALEAAHARPGPGSAVTARPPPDDATITAAAAVLADPHPLVGDATRGGLQSLLDLAARSRLELAALAHARDRTAARGAATEAQATGALLTEAADGLTEVAEVLDPRSVRRRSRRQGSTPRPGGDVPDSVVVSSRALSGQVRAALEVAAGVRDGAVAPSEGTPATGEIGRLLRRPALAEPLATLRAALDLRSEALRHALRLAVVVASVSAVGFAVGLGHGYWIAITALVVLRPDIASTVGRGTSRLIGTAGGVTIATLLAQLHPGPWALVVLTTACAATAYSVLRVNQAVFVAALSAYVVFLLAQVDLPEGSAGAVRLLDTAIGGAVALVAYFTWPTWEGGRLRERLADQVEAIGAYTGLVLCSYVSSDERAPGPIQEAGAAARRRRAAAEASVARTADEAGPGAESTLGAGVVAAVQRVAQAALTLEARRPELPGETYPAATALSRQVPLAAGALAAGLRDRCPARDLPPLRATQQALVGELGRETLAARLLAAETDLLVDALDTIAHLLTAPADGSG